MRPVEPTEPRAPTGPLRPAHLFWRALIGVLVSGAVLYLLVRQTSGAQLAELVETADRALLLAGGAAYLALSLLRAVRIRVLFPEGRYVDLFAVTAVHQLLLRVMPARTGELGFAWLMRRSGYAGFTRGLVGLLLLRILDLATVLVAAGLAIAATPAGRTVARPELVAITLIVLGLGVAGAARGGIGLGARVIATVAGWLGLDRRPFVARATGALREAGAWSAALPHRTLGAVIAVTLAQWLVTFVMIFVIAAALGLAPRVSDAIVAATGTVFGSIVPLPSVGTFGALEAGWAGGFALSGVPLDRAVSTGLGFSLATLAYSALLGALGAAWLARRGAGPTPLTSDGSNGANREVTDEAVGEREAP